MLTGWVLAGEEPVVVWEWASERRFDAAAPARARHPQHRGAPASAAASARSA